MAFFNHADGTYSASERLDAYIKEVFALEHRVVSTFTARKGEAGDNDGADFKTDNAPRGSDLFFSVKRYGAEARWTAGPISRDLFQLCFPDLRGETRTKRKEDIRRLKIFVKILNDEHPRHSKNFNDVVRGLMKEGAYATLSIMMQLLNGEPSEYRYRMAELCFQGSLKNKTATQTSITEFATYLDTLPYSTRKKQFEDYIHGLTEAELRNKESFLRRI